MTLLRIVGNMTFSLLPVLVRSAQTLGLATFLGLLSLAPAQASTTIRVAVARDVAQVNVGSSVNARVINESNQVLGELQAMNGFTAQPKDGRVALDRWTAGYLRIEPKDPSGVVWIGDRWYRGTVYVVPNGKTLTAINYVDLDQYLFSVLGKEMNGKFPMEALKAQAVAARSYALYEMRNTRSKGGNFDVGNDQGWQVYGGVQSETTTTQQAVAATTGQVLIDQSSQPILAAFHSSAGGCMENVEEVWTQPLSYLRASKTPYDVGAPVYSWTVNLTSEQLSSRFNVGKVTGFEPVSTSSVCGRVKQMKVVGDKGTQLVDGDKLRQVLGLRSTLFAIVPQYAPTASATPKNKNNPNPDKAEVVSFVVNGKGFGHGLGMSQWGAYNMANQGLNYQQILAHYYKSVRLTVPDTAQGNR
jgi:stage II sporulation protein D